MYRRYLTPPASHFFLFGPRGTGKTTWLKTTYPDAFWIDLLNPETLRLYAATPERLKQQVESFTTETTIIIDEVQRLPQLLNVVHSLIEAKRGHLFVMTGSSARKLRREGVNLLGGRAALRHMPPFFASEIGDDFTLERNLLLGMLPLVLDAPDPSEVLRAYAGIYMKEEVQAEGLVRRVDDFARFLETMSFSHGSLLNASAIARESAISRKSVDVYLSILEDLLLAFRLSPFTRRAKRSLIQREKFYFFDSGVYASLRPQSLYDRQSELEGVSLEGLVAQHLLAWTSMQHDRSDLFFWRTRHGSEVDFIVTTPTHLYAIEVKNGTVVHPKDLKGLTAFTTDYPEATPILLYRGAHIYKEKGVVCHPIEPFLTQIRPSEPLYSPS